MSLLYLQRDDKIQQKRVEKIINSFEKSLELKRGKNNSNNLKLELD